MSNPDKVVGEIVVSEGPKPLPGFRYEVNILFNKKPDFSLLVEQYRAYGIPRDPMTREIWDMVAEEIDSGIDNGRTELVLHSFVDPSLTHPDDKILTAIDKVDTESGDKPLNEWYRVQLFLMNKKKIPNEEMRYAITESLKRFFDDKVFLDTFLEVRGLRLFSDEKPKVVKRIPLTVAMLEKSADRHV